MRVGLSNYLFPKGVVDSRIKDCNPRSSHELAASIEVIKREPKGPDIVSSMITEVPYGRWQVQFQAFPNEPLNVTTKDLRLGTGFIGSLGYKLIEAAFLKLNSDRPINRKEYALPVLTGGPLITMSLSETTPIEVKETLQVGGLFLLFNQELFRYYPVVGFDKTDKIVHYLDMSDPMVTKSIALSNLPSRFSNLDASFF